MSVNAKTAKLFRRQTEAKNHRFALPPEDFRPFLVVFEFGHCHTWFLSNRFRKLSKPDDVHSITMNEFFPQSPGTVHSLRSLVNCIADRSDRHVGLLNFYSGWLVGGQISLVIVIPKLELFRLWLMFAYPTVGLHVKQTRLIWLILHVSQHPDQTANTSLIIEIFYFMVSVSAMWRTLW